MKDIICGNDQIRLLLIGSNNTSRWNGNTNRIYCHTNNQEWIDFLFQFAIIHFQIFRIIIFHERSNALNDILPVFQYFFSFSSVFIRSTIKLKLLKTEFRTMYTAFHYNDTLHCISNRKMFKFVVLFENKNVW